MQNGWKWLWRFTSWFLVLMLLALFFVVGYAKVKGINPRIYGHEILIVISGSMEPMIKTGSIIAVKMKTDELQYEVGDVITFRTQDDPQLLITHRIIEVLADGAEKMYVTQGDNNDAPDPFPVHHGLVVGKYANFTIPFLGQFLTFAKTQAGIIMLLVIPGALLILSQFVSIWRLLTKEEETARPEDEKDKLVQP